MKQLTNRVKLGKRGLPNLRILRQRNKHLQVHICRYVTERFFYAYAQSYRSKVRESQLLTWIKSDPHSPDEFRVTGVVRNHPAFYSTFAVRPGDGMYLAPEERVSIW